MSYTSTTSKSKSEREAVEEIRHADPVEVFTARCQARGLLFKAGELELNEAVDVLQDAAEYTGLVTSLGQDAVQTMMADAFQTTQPVHDGDAQARPSNEPYHLVPRDGPASTAQMQRAHDRTLAERFRHRLPASTVDALYYVLAQKDPQRLRQFLAGRTAHELRLMRVHVNAKMG
jgi:hypothetical protein